MVAVLTFCMSGSWGCSKDDEKDTVAGKAGQINLAMTNGTSASLHGNSAHLDDPLTYEEPTIYSLKIIAINLMGTNPYSGEEAATFEVPVWVNPNCTPTDEIVTEETDDEIIEYTFKNPFECQLEDMDYVPLAVTTTELNEYLNSAKLNVPPSTYTGVNLMLSNGKDQVETVKVLKFQASGMDSTHEIVGFDGGMSVDFATPLEVTEDTDATVSLTYDLSQAISKSIGDSADNLPIETDNCFQDASILTTWCTNLGAGSIVPSVEQ
jgi:hypothetical protein